MPKQQPTHFTATYTSRHQFRKEQQRLAKLGWVVDTAVDQAWNRKGQLTRIAVTYRRVDAPTQLSPNARHSIRYPTGSVPEWRQSQPPPMSQQTPPRLDWTGIMEEGQPSLSDDLVTGMLPSHEKIQPSSPPPSPPYYPLPSRPPSPPHRYSGWMLFFLVVTYLIAMGFLVLEIAATSGFQTGADSTISSGGTSILGTCVVLLLLALHGCIIVLDSRSFFTLFGRIRWKRSNGWLKALIVFGYLCVFVMPFLYLLYAVQHFLQVRQQTLGQAVGSGWLWYKQKQRGAQIGIAVVSLLLICAFIAFTSYAASTDRAMALASLTPTVTPQSTVRATSPAATPSTSGQVPLSTSTAQPSAKPTPKPKPTQPPPPPTLTLTCASAIDYLSGQVCVYTEPGAALTITVRYCSGYKATSDSLQGTVYADGAGNYEWTWEPETECRGAATATVNADWNGQNTSNTDTFTVQ